MQVRSCSQKVTRELQRVHPKSEREMASSSANRCFYEMHDTACTCICSIKLTMLSGGVELTRAIMIGKSPSEVLAVIRSSMWLYRSPNAVSASELNSAPCWRMDVSTSMKLVLVFKSSL